VPDPPRRVGEQPARYCGKIVAGWRNEVGAGCV
jgi:hypothetical protein